MQQNLNRAITDDVADFYEAPWMQLTAAHGQYQSAPLPHMHLADKTDDLSAMRDMADALAEGAERILILTEQEGRASAPGFGADPRCTNTSWTDFGRIWFCRQSGR